MNTLAQWDKASAKRKRLQKQYDEMAARGYATGIIDMAELNRISKQIDKAVEAQINLSKS